MLQLIQIELHVYESMDEIAHLRTVQYFSETYETFCSLYIKIRKPRTNQIHCRILKKKSCCLSNKPDIVGFGKTPQN